MGTMTFLQGNEFVSRLAKRKSFKITVKRKVFWARAKELFVWSPSFVEVPEKELYSHNESVKINEEANNINNGEEENDSEIVSDTYFGDNGDDQVLEHHNGETSNVKEVSSDPFNIYGLIDKHTKDVRNRVTQPASYPPGGILCAWDVNLFKKDHHTISDNFVALYGTWIPNNQKLERRKFVNGGFYDVRCSEEGKGYSFTWAHPSATKMSKLDRFLMSNGFLSAFPHISAVCLDRHLSDHRPILLKEVSSDFGPSPFRFFHSWLDFPGFDELVSKSWNSFALDDSNGMIRFKKKLQLLKKEIRTWIMDFKRHQMGLSVDLKSKLCDIDKTLDQGGVSEEILLSRMEVLKQLHDVQSSSSRDIMQKAKIIVLELEAPISNDDIRTAVWGCGVDKSPGPDGFTFEFFRKFWTVIGPDFCIAVKWFFEHGGFAIGCNSSFVTLIPEVLDPKTVSDFRPISLIGSLYKVVTKILATRLSLVISDLISDVHTAFLPNRQILDGPFIINEVLSRCKFKKQQAMIFKVDFAKAYDSVRWDFLDDVLSSFGFRSRWRSWVRGSLSSGIRFYS
ncbi:RNA-directed DNA polymerase, eukaryota [Tanacetum coccineum]